MSLAVNAFDLGALAELAAAQPTPATTAEALEILLRARLGPALGDSADAPKVFQAEAATAATLPYIIFELAVHLPGISLDDTPVVADVVVRAGTARAARGLGNAVIALLAQPKGVAAPARGPLSSPEGVETCTLQEGDARLIPEKIGQRAPADGSAPTRVFHYLIRFRIWLNPNAPTS